MNIYLFFYNYIINLYKELKLQKKIEIEKALYLILLIL